MTPRPNTPPDTTPLALYSLRYWCPLDNEWKPVGRRRWMHRAQAQGTLNTIHDVAKALGAEVDARQKDKLVLRNGDICVVVEMVGDSGTEQDSAEEYDYAV